jgi:hypothetical protein
LIEQFEDFREDALLFGIVFFDRKVQESEFSIDLEKHLRSDFPDLTGNEFGGVENGDNGFLDDFTQELNGDFIE